MRGRHAISVGGMISWKIQTDFIALSRLEGPRAVCSAASVPLSARVFAQGAAGEQAHGNAPLSRPSQLHSPVFSPTERATYAKWKRGVAAFYTSVALLTVISIAYFHYRGDGAQNQTVNLRPVQIN